jgi:hypothetical protein
MTYSINKYLSFHPKNYTQHIMIKCRSLKAEEMGNPPRQAWEDSCLDKTGRVAHLVCVMRGVCHYCILIVMEQDNPLHGAHCHISYGCEACLF